jgi:hypothetical protein
MKGVYDYCVGSLSDKLGWNKYLIQSLALTFLLPLFYAIKLLFSPLSKEKRRYGGILLIVMAVAWNLMFYFATKDIAFGFGQRETLKYYARTDKGIVFYDRPGFDPTTGQALKPVTPEIIRNLEQLREGPLAKVDPSAVPWFNPYTGAPDLWYYRFPDGQLEFYNRPGMHPQTGEVLSPVTKEIFLNWRSTYQLSATRGSVNKGQSQSNKGNVQMASSRNQLVVDSGSTSYSQAHPVVQLGPKQVQTSTEVRRIRVVADNCRGENETLVCTLTVTSQQDDLYLKVRAGSDPNLPTYTKAYDDIGGEYIPDTAVFAGKTTNSEGEAESLLVSETPTLLVFKFDEFNRSCMKVRLLVFRAYVWHGEEPYYYSEFKLRNIPIQR